MEGELHLLGYAASPKAGGTAPGEDRMDALNEALISIRRILRATEIHGKALRAAADLKTSQLMVLQTLEDEPELTVGQITERVRMAQASVTAIVARLEQMDLVRRERGTTDKRKVFVNLTDAGHDILEQAPEALHRRFAEQFEPLEAWEKTMIVAALQRVASMMDAHKIDASPVLTVGEIDGAGKRK